MKAYNTNKGFSLIELIVVIAILAVFTIMLAPKILFYTERSRVEKDNSSMDEVVNAIQLALADQEIYDEVLRFSTVDNVSCYVDTNSEANYSKIVTKKNPDGIDQYTFTSDARRLDETPYFAAGNMRGVTITFAPDKGSNGSTFDLKQGVVNQYVQVSGNQRFGALPKLYANVKSSVGETITNTSQTYRNSEYTVFIVMGTIGGNDESAQDATKFYGQWSGTNLPQQVSYQLVTDRITGDDGKQIVEIDDDKWNETNGSKITIKPGDLNGGGTYVPSNSQCKHKNKTEVQGNVDASCTSEGYTGDTVCMDCKKIILTGETIPVKEHKYLSERKRTLLHYTCEMCGDHYTTDLKKPTASIDAIKVSSTGKIKIKGTFEDFENFEEYYEITSHGIIFIEKNRIGTRTLTVNTSGRTRVNFESYNSNGEFSYTFKPTTKTTNYATRVFLCYTDENGTSKYIYSPQRIVNYNTASAE